jgi:hypothetical protein
MPEYDADPYEWVLAGLGLASLAFHNDINQCPPTNIAGVMTVAQCSIVNSDLKLVTCT